MQESYILTTMFFADDYCTQVKTAEHHDFLSSHANLFGPTPYRQPVSYKQNGLNSSLADPAVTPRQVTLDLGQEHIIEWLDWWPNQEETERVPQAWQVEVSLDGKNYFQVFAIDRLDYLWGTALLIDMPCALRLGHVVSFLPVKARFVRFYFDNASRKNVAAEWAVELKLTSVDENQSFMGDFSMLPHFGQQFAN